MALIRASGPLSRALRSAFPERPFHVRFWDGGVVEATSDGAPTFFVRKPSALSHFLRAPGTLGLGRAYVDGSLTVDDLDDAFIVVDEWEPPELSVGDRVRLGLGIAAAALPGGLPRRPSLELILHGERHSLERDAAAIRYHYDVGNEFFALFLDESMTYSCAIFSRGAQTLEEAQRTKLDLVASKLALEPGMRVLDVGCGWGSFAIHAAKHYGVTVTGLTLSPSQAELAREKVAEAGLSEQVKIRVADYRELPGGSFDAIASIGMSEHVGESQIDRYAKSLFALLRPGGVLLNHAIAALDPEYDSLDDEFSMRYVFPDGEALPLSRVQLALERAGFHVDHVEAFREDYARTLRDWTARLDEHLEQAERLAGVERTRIWRLYLRAARHGFDTSITAVYQIRARRPI
ncbi:MAG TPA: cyclopropane-fatty-acyl-phospholipid synthase family protein [Solirubrobacteraceae bacterium]|nr:cyclopropane-fatty-acyl-phospholipid synthase family protein [Solirubrobacteraceae bacterium]